MTTPEEIITCVNETSAAIADIAEDLPDCVNTTLTLLATCSLESLDVCAESCQGISFAFGDDLDVTDLATCNLIQENIMVPLCSNNCCPQCQQELEEVAECVANDVLGFTVRPCDLSCGDGGGRRLGTSLRGSDKGN